MRGCRVHGLYAAALLLVFQFSECSSLNLEGLALLEFQRGVESDPFGALESWDADDDDPCNWSGVHCADGNVEILYLMELSLGGVLSPELGKLSHLRALMLQRNKFAGVIPKEIGELNMLEHLDLRGNDLSGTIPRELGEMSSLTCLLLCDNKFEGGTPSWLEKLGMVSDIQNISELSCETGNELGCTSRNLGYWLKIINGYSHDPAEKDGDILTNSAESYIKGSKRAVNNVRRQLLQETSNLAALPVSGSPPLEVAMVPSAGSGSFAAISSSNSENDGKKEEASPYAVSSPPIQTPASTNLSGTADKKLAPWEYILVAIVGIFLILAAITVLVCCRRRRSTIGPWKAGLSGQLRKAFVTGATKLNRADLEAACEDFSNIIISFPHSTLFKGTLSSGVEICVVSTSVKSIADWPERSELCFRKKIETLQRVNHKNFLNLLGYCEEHEPFTRMMVFEYTSCQTLFSHLHVDDYDHLDWSARMRIIMGIAYCLQYMHHEVNPPVALSSLVSRAVLITEDFAGKLLDFCLFRESVSDITIPGDDRKDASKPWEISPESNVYGFGMLMLEVISGKLQCSEEEGFIVDWAAKYLDDESMFSSLVDATLKSSNNAELRVICEMICKCLCQDPKKRPTMKEITTALKEVTGISPEAATPRLSPLWWAELEILSGEGN